MPLLMIHLVLLCVVAMQAGWATEASDTLVTTGQVYFPRLQFRLRDPVARDKLWDIWPIGDQNLRQAIRAHTNINILTDPVVVNLDHPEQLYLYPFVFMTSDGEFSLSDTNRATLRDYLMRGGFLYADDCTYMQKEDRFYQAWIKEMKIIFSDKAASVHEVSNDHDIFSCFHKLDGIPWVQGQVEPAMGVFDNESGRLMALCTSGDLHCGWVRFPNLSPDGCTKCIEMGENIMVYCLTH